MPKPIKLKLALGVLTHKGFVFVSQKGSHAKYRKYGNPVANVIIKTDKKKSHTALSDLL
jgi:predicted RNA binding protein YcfA (HicA-like mRNA interferase family)